MTFEEVLPELKEGKKIRRENWNKIHEIHVNDDYIVDENDEYFPFVLEDFSTNDWEVVEEKKKVKLRDLTGEQYKNWYKNNCGEYDCIKCIFYRVPCAYDTINCWIKNKDLYSDKFLDQEIEIED